MQRIASLSKEKGRARGDDLRTEDWDDISLSAQCAIYLEEKRREKRERVKEPSKGHVSIWGGRRAWVNCIVGDRKNNRTMEGRERIGMRHGIVSRHKAYKAPKIGFGAVSRRSPEARRCVSELCTDLDAAKIRHRQHK